MAFLLLAAPLIVGGLAAGGVFSKNKNIQTLDNNLTASILAKVLIDVTSRCDVSSNNSQTMSGNSIIISGVKNSTVEITAIQNIQSKLLATCTQKQDISEEIASKFAAELDKTVTQATQGFTSADNISSTINNIKKELNANINIKSLTECLSKIVSNQQMLNNKIELYNITDQSIVSIDWEQIIVTNLISECLQSQTTVTKLNDELVSKIKELDNQTQKGFDLNEAINSLTKMVTDLFNTIMGTWYFMLIGIIFLFYLLGCKFPMTKSFATALGICSESKKNEDKKEIVYVYQDQKNPYIIPYNRQNY